MIGIVANVAIWVLIAWTWSAFIRYGARHVFRTDLPPAVDRVTRALFWELRPLCLWCWGIYNAHQLWSDRGSVGDLAMDLIIAALSFFSWWVYKDPKDDDDDRWKRRREKLTAKVERVAGRLTVVPAGASA